MKVTYLIGAGGSCGTIPLAKSLGADIAPLSETIKQDMMAYYQKGVPVYPEDRQPPPSGSHGANLFAAFEWLHRTAQNHNSVDTIARKLWMRGDAHSLEELRKLKATLTAYLWYKQISQPTSKRYDTFFATILQKKGDARPVLPRPISILTWNYDLLIERSFFEYSLNYEHAIDHLLNEKRVVHLNGFGSVDPTVKVAFLPNDYSKFQSALFHDCEDRFAILLDIFDRCMKFHPTERLDTKVQFAWENSNRISDAENVVRSTTILVIVGYSFPYFNRDADKLLLEAAHPTISKIYLQVNQDVGAKERLLSILNEIPASHSWKDLIIDIKDKEEILIPNELIQ